MTINMKDSFLIPKQDRAWIKKILIGSLLASFMITAPIANGYIVLYLYSQLKVINKRLPEWVQIGKIIIISLKLIVIDILYLLLPVVFIGIITQPHGTFAFKKAAILWLPIVLISTFFLNIAHVNFAKNDFKISAGFNIKEIFILLKLNIKNYLPVYIFNVVVLLIIFVPVFIDIHTGMSFIFNYLLILLLSTILFYSYLIISNMLATIFTDRSVNEKQ